MRIRHFRLTHRLLLTLKQRKPNWIDEEMGVLAEEYASSIRIIRSKLSPITTSVTKRRVWEMINQK